MYDVNFTAALGMGIGGGYAFGMVGMSYNKY
jgi:hypothetical protein